MATMDINLIINLPMRSPDVYDSMDQTPGLATTWQRKFHATITDGLLGAFN
jgi:hypothetical protein